VFFSFDEARATVGEVLNTYREMNNKDFREKRAYVFLDEIQKCNNWENEVKKYHQHPLPNPVFFRSFSLVPFHLGAF